MSFLQLAKNRYSVRKFSDKKIEQEKLDLILEAGRVAPTAVNYQSQRIMVMDKEDSLSKLKECTRYHFNAPLALLVCYDSSVSWKNPYSNEDNGKLDATIVATHMMLEVAELGLGTTFVADFNPDMIRKVYDLPDFLVPIAILPIGYPSEHSVPTKLHSMRKDIKETVFYNTFKEIKKGENNPDQHKLLAK